MKTEDLIKDKTKPIGFMDSGVGGISVLREAVRVLPNEDFIYYGDSANAPYGTRSPEEIKELVNIAHGEGFAVMAHCNGRDTVMAALEAGTDSIEHGAFMDSECLAALSESNTIWVPTIAAIAAFSGRRGSGENVSYEGRPGFDKEVTRMTAEAHMAAVSKAGRLGAKIAAGSDSGAFGVPHGSGTLSEYSLLCECGISAESIIEANELIRGRFRR